MKTHETSRNRSLLENLPFTSPDAQVCSGLSMWSPPRTNDWSADCQIGRDYAAAALEYMAATDNVTLLARIMERIVKNGAFDGVETGFFTGIAMASIRTEE